MASSIEYRSLYQGEKFEELLKCPICYEVYKSPRALACLHTFCEPCISSYIEGQDSGKYAAGDLPCPTCRQITRIPDTTKSPKDWAKLLPYNYTILPLIEAYNDRTEQKNKNNKNCISCSGKVSEFFAVCEDCAGNLCSRCTSLHEELKLFKDHDIIRISLDSDHRNCSKHLDKKVDYVCIHHNELLCSTCVVVNHRTCDEIRELKDIVTKDEVKIKFCEVKSELEALQTFLFQSVNDILTENDQLKAKAAENNETIKKFKEHVDNLISGFQQMQLHGVQDNEEKTQAYFIQCQKTLGKVQKIEKILEVLEPCTQMTSLFLALDGFSLQIQGLQEQILSIKGAGHTDIGMPAELEALINMVPQPILSICKQMEQMEMSSNDGKTEGFQDPAKEVPEATALENMKKKLQKDEQAQTVQQSRMSSTDEQTDCPDPNGELSESGDTCQLFENSHANLSNFPTQEENCSGGISQQVLWVEEHDKLTILLYHLAKSGPGSLVIIYVETKDGADALEEFLSLRKYPVTSIHGSHTRRKREEALRLFSTGEKPILVTTSVAAQGKDVPKVQHIVNFDLPNNKDEYLNRMCKLDLTRTGLVTSFFNEMNKHMTRDLIHVLVDASQSVPSWLESFANSARPVAASRQRAYYRS
ncbi:E3 ubiquitin/ISG15 ligase TRIM25-like isoform X2 [Mercenaria mercenaria]|uniref:E3 ubiquitin/ISG15 ligase TRIM25-like isoform X2 n=1 Tax=Mercenaria mercenaria TaxID=6596 RepID=UPI00234EF60D|nr:E3 ubiquitin/ISG15 ligase TRIM25-like isoform X2 [Mercenaria mercenaria]